MSRIALLAASLLVVAASADKTTFAWKPAPGAIGTFKTTNSHKANFNGAEEDLVIAWESKIKVDKVEKERVWFKIENSEPVATIGGSDTAGIQVQVPDSTEIHGLDGKFFPSDEDEGARYGLYGGFRLPDKAIEVGESYTLEGLKAKYEGTEKVGAWEGHKFTFTAKAKEKGPWCEGTIWLSTKDLSLLRRKSVLHDFDFGMGPETINNEVVRTK